MSICSGTARKATSALLCFAVTLAAGCDSASKKASTQLKRLEQSESQTAEELSQQGWKLEQKGRNYFGKFDGTVTDEMLQRLQEFQHFSSLDLSNAKLTHEQMKLVGELKNLFNLNLSGTAITDEDLKPINELPLLVSLDLTGTQVTAPAVEDWVEVRQASTHIMPVFKNTNIKGFATGPKVPVSSKLLGGD